MTGATCTVCMSTNFRYDEEYCREICNICNTMMDFTGIGVASYINDSNINFDRLKTYNLNKKLKNTKAEKENVRLSDAEPWKIQDLFKWIFEKQVVAMKPYVVDWESFNQLSLRIWDKYLTSTGTKFDILKESNDKIKMQNYPIGWGSKYDPKEGTNLLAKANIEFLRLKRENAESDEELDKEKMKKNAKKIRIERMIHMKRVNDEEMQRDIELTKKDLVRNIFLNEEKGEEKNEKEVFYQELEDSSSSSEESALSDEDDPSYLQLDFMDEKEKNKVRILQKKRPYEVMFKGSYNTIAYRYMENNILMLFLTLYFSRKKTPQCCCLMDILRLVRSQIVPYIRIRGFIPNHLFYINDVSYHAFLRRDDVPSWDFLMTSFNRLYMDLKFNFLIRFDIDSLIRRMVNDLNLPMGLCNLIDFFRNKTKSYNEGLINSLPNSNLIRTDFKSIGRKLPYTFLPEPFCLAYIFIGIRSLVRLNGVYELQTSEYVKQLEQLELIKEGHLFVWTDWWRQMFKAQSLRTAKNWDDFEKVNDGVSFLENIKVDNEDMDKFSHLNLEWNDDLNHRGRYANPHKPITQQKVIDDIEEPFLHILKQFNEIHDLKPMKNFTETDIRYLVEPEAIKTCIEYISPGYSQCVTEGSLIVDKLVDIIRNHNLSLERISYVKPDFSENIFDKKFCSNTTEIEDDLLRILTYGTGLRSNQVLRHVRLLESVIFKNVSKRIKKKRNFFG